MSEMKKNRAIKAKAPAQRATARFVSSDMPENRSMVPSY
jgi:hypothetical protein